MRAQQLHLLPARPCRRRAGTEVLRGPRRLQVGFREDERDRRNHRRRVVRRHGRARPYLRQGRDLCRGTARGNARRYRQIRLRALCRDHRAVRQPPLGRGGLPHDAGAQGRTAGAPLHRKKDAGVWCGYRPCQSCGRLQGVLCGRQLGHLPLLRHGAAASHGRGSR